MLLALLMLLQSAEANEPLVAIPRTTAPATTVLPRNTPVNISLNNALIGKEAREGDTFDLTVTQDVLLNDLVVIPRGSMARGQVTWMTKKGMFGKSGKMTVEFRYIMVGNRRVSISGSFRQEGEGNTVATVGTVVAAGPFGALVTGRSAYIPKGREFEVFTTEDIPVALPAKVGASENHSE